MEGFLSKKGKRMGSRVKRYMKLDGSTLSNHHSPDGPATWQVSIKDATVSANPKRKKLNLELYNANMELYCDTRAECENWVVALDTARKALLSKSKEDDKENSTVGEGNGRGGPGGPSDTNLKVDTTDTVPMVDGKKKELPKAMDQLNKSFKVVRPPVRAVQSINTDSESSDDDDFVDDNEDEHQPRNGPRIEEETPNSMIFKQFNFKA